MLVGLQSWSVDGGLGAVDMPAKFCSGNQRCSNHQDQPSRDNAVTDCKEFIIIGNGPSGIVLSYMLAGHWPYYAGCSQDELLHARLMLEPGLSLVEQDLQFLSEGLEGRSNYPVALLLDALQKPEADLGLKLPSLLEWRHHEDRAVDHLVLGRGKPGGVWQSLDSAAGSGDMLTVSLGGWMELPQLSMTQWRDQATDRATVAAVSRYYEDYVASMGLGGNFRSHTTVTGVREVTCPAPAPASPAPSAPALGTEEVFRFEADEDELEGDDLSSLCSSLTRRRSLSSNSFESACFGPSPSPGLASHAAAEPGLDLSASLSNWDPFMDPSLFCPSYSMQSPASCPPSADSYCPSAAAGRCGLARSCCPAGDTMFEVTGYRQQPGDPAPVPFSYLARNVVLATGQADTPNVLGVAGEQLPCVLHALAQLTSLVKTRRLGPRSAPVVVVGAGLSAADAIIAAQSHSIPVVHVFRKQARDPGLIFSRLPAKLYPEYHAVHQMMGGLCPRPGYQPLPQSHILEICPDNTVRVSTEDNQELVIKASYVLVLIGSAADLSFLGDTARRLGVAGPGLAISRTNPVEVDVFTHQTTAVPGLFAMGPLIGDNFVRFIQGGALAITNFAQQQRKMKGKKDEKLSF